MIMAISLESSIKTFLWPPGAVHIKTLNIWLAFVLLLHYPAIRTGVSARVTTSCALERHPPVASPVTRWSRCCKGVEVMWPCWLPGTHRAQDQQPLLPHHPQTPPPSRPYPPGCQTCPLSGGSAGRWVAKPGWCCVFVSQNLVRCVCFSLTWRDTRFTRFLWQRRTARVSASPSSATTRCPAKVRRWKTPHKPPLPLTTTNQQNSRYDSWWHHLGFPVVSWATPL